MDALWTLEWRPYPAALAFAVGAWLTARGVVLGWSGLRQPTGRPGKNWLIVRGMRLFLFGRSLAAVAAGWWLQWPAMVAAGLVIGFEETLETSIAASALRAETERDIGHAP